MADGHRRVEETDEALERRLAAKFARLVAEETQPLRAALEDSRAALEASKSECDALRKRAAQLEACLASRQAEEQPLIPGLPNHLVDADILRSDFLRDPTDLANFRAVSCGMRDAVDATGRKIKELKEEEAAYCGYLSTLKCLRRRGRLRNNGLVCAAAARSGDLDELRSLRVDDYPWDEKTCAHAARGGHLEALKWARENDCPWDRLTCANAAEGGHLETLKWLRENECPWDKYTCSCAAEGGHLEVLKWAHANGAPLTHLTRKKAVANGHREVVQWLEEIGE